VIDWWCITSSAMAVLEPGSAKDSNKWICQVNAVGLFSHTDDHRFAFSTQATDRMYGRVIF
jgi:hypothetical protein